MTIGNPLDESTLMGPLVNESAVNEYLDAIKRVCDEGGEVYTAERCWTALAILSSLHLLKQKIAMIR